MRLFVAVTPPARVLDHLAGEWDRARAALRSGRWMARENWHLTLEFLGELEDSEAAAVRTALAAVAARRTPIDLRLAGVGTFGPRGRKILWTGLRGDLEGLRALAVDVRDATTAALDRESEARPYRAHLTLARDVRNAKPALEAMRAYEGPSWTVGELQLIASELGAGAAGSSRYRLVARWSLEGIEDHDSATVRAEDP